MGTLYLLLLLKHSFQPWRKCSLGHPVCPLRDFRSTDDVGSRLWQTAILSVGLCGLPTVI